jgi:hypothetical protein
MEVVVQLILGVLLLCVLVWGVKSLTAAWGVGEPIATTALVVVVLIALLVLFGYLGYPGMASLRRH